MHHRHPFFKKLCVTAACAAAVVPVFAEAAAYQYRANLQGLVVSGPGPSLDNLSVALATSQLPDAIVGVPYSANLNQLLSVTGDAAYSGEGVSWGVVSNSLPAGLYLTVDGYIGGTPTAEGAGAIQVRASYKTANGEQTYQVVSIPLMVSLAAATLPSGRVGQAYTYNLRDHLLVTGDKALDLNQATLTTADALPAGLSLAANGVLSGTPTVKNEAGASFQVLASYKGKEGQQVYTIKVGDAVLEVVQVTAGTQHTCAVTPAGGLKCWGYDGYGQLGNDAAMTNQPTPVDVLGLTSGVASVSAGSAHTCAVTSAGGVKCWGFDNYGQLGNDSALASQPTPVDVQGLTSGVASVEAGASHTCAVTTAGGLKCWGWDAQGQLGNDTALTNQPTPVNVLGLTSGVTSVAAGNSHTCAVTTAGGLKCWGYDGNGQLGNDTALTRQPTPVDVLGLTSGVTSVAAGNSHTCAVTTAGGLKCWGYDYYGQLGNDTALTDKPTPVDVLGLTSGVTSVAAGYYHTCAVTTSGGLKCWGYDQYGGLGNDAALTDQPTPVDVLGLTSGVTSVSLGYNHTCAVTTSGGVKCWGYDYYGQLGNDAALTNQPTPMDVTQ